MASYYPASIMLATLPRREARLVKDIHQLYTTSVSASYIVTEHLSTFSIISFSFWSRVALDWAESCGTSTLIPKNLTCLVMNGIFCCDIESLGSKSWPLDPWIVRLAYLATLALIPDHSSHLSTMSNKCCAEAGPLARMQVSSAYCRRFSLHWESEIQKPKSSLVCRVSTRVFITVLNITTNKRSPW